MMFYMFIPKDFVVPAGTQVLNECSSKCAPAEYEGRTVFIKVEDKEAFCFAVSMTSLGHVFVSEDPSCDWWKFEIELETQ